MKTIIEKIFMIPVAYPALFAFALMLVEEI
jgi:hypothetical protein